MNKTYGGLVSEPQNYKNGTHIGGDTTYTFGGTITTTDVVIPGGDTPEPHDYSQDYLTFVALEDGTFSFYVDSGISTENLTSLSYSIDDGNSWTTWTNDGETTGNVLTTQTITAGNKVLWKGSGLALSNDEIDPYSWFVSTGRYDVQGNIMSLLYGDNFVNQTTIGNHAFAYLFINHAPWDSGENYLVSAENMILPATTLAEYCYAAMFSRCTNLTIAPQLPATTLANYCYQTMFSRCTSLTVAPQLPATTLTNGCYSCMFYGCTNLNNITCLATNISATGCTTDWVNSVASSGTFTKAAGMTDWTTGDSGIPTNWTVVDAE